MKVDAKLRTPHIIKCHLLHVLSGLSAPFNAERVPYLYWSLNLSFLNFPCTVWCRVSVCWGCHDWFALEIIGAAGGVTKSTLRRMGDHSQSLSQPASVSTPSQLFHIKAVNCDFTVRVLHNCFTNREEGLLWQILCQEVEAGEGGRESQLQTGCVLITMQIDANFFTLVRRGYGWEWEADWQERESKLTSCSWDDLVRRATALLTLASASNGLYTPWKPSFPL